MVIKKIFYKHNIFLSDGSALLKWNLLTPEKYSPALTSQNTRPSLFSLLTVQKTTVHQWPI